MTTTAFQAAKDAAQARREQELSEASLREAERVAAARRAREEREKRELLQQYREYVQRCREAFYEGVAKHALEHNWAVAAIEAAEQYCVGLAYDGADEPKLPRLNKEMMDVIHTIFVRKIVFYGDKLPQNPFYGQKQEWYPELLQEIQKPKRERSYRPRPAAVRIPTPGEVFPPASEQEKNDNVVELRPAITPSKKVKKARSAG
jgi:hypothetical protein